MAIVVGEAEGDLSPNPELRQCDVAHTKGCISNQATDTYLQLSHVTAWRVGQPNTPSSRAVASIAIVWCFLVEVAVVIRIKIF